MKTTCSAPQPPIAFFFNEVKIKVKSRASAQLVRKGEALREDAAVSARKASLMQMKGHHHGDFQSASRTPDFGPQPV